MFTWWVEGEVLWESKRWLECNVDLVLVMALDRQIMILIPSVGLNADTFVLCVCHAAVCSL